MSEDLGPDKKGWPRGAWDAEPDRLEWRAHGLPCLIVRGPVGALCGYVGVPPGHPWHGKGYDDVRADVHGGLTYAEKCNDHICHVPLPGEPDDVWWLGFDCAHYMDVAPAMFQCRSYSNSETYKDIAYVRRETEDLAKQASVLL